MKDETKKDLDSVFSSFHEKKNRQREEQEQRESEDERLLAEFVSRRSDVIRPAMEEMKEYIEAQGYTCRIEEKDQTTTSDGKHEPASITFYFNVDSPARGRAYEYPHFSARWDRTKRKVQFHESTMSPSSGGQAGPAGDAALDEMSKDLIHERIASIVKKTFK